MRADIRVLAADHAAHARGRRELGGGLQHALGGRALVGEQVAEGLRVQSVAREDRDVLAELHMTGGLAASQPVVVHRRQVVVDQRVGVDQLDRPRQRQHLLLLGPDRPGGRQREHGTDALPARQQRVAHRFLEPRSQGLAGKAHRLEVALDLLAQVLGISGLHGCAEPYSRVSWPGAGAEPCSRVSRSSSAAA